jgi:uncharacterized protein (TIGR00251 family)
VDVEELYQFKGDDAVVLAVHVQPGSGQTVVVGRHGTALKVRVAVPPEAGRANEACASLLADTFGADAAQVELVSGAQSRSKRFKLSGLDLDEFRRRLEQVVSEGTGGQKAPPGRRG